MHMADALISPAVGGTMWTVSLGLAVLSARKLKNMPKENVPLMGVLGAFVFAAQMINFTIPMTGSSGHIGGGLLLAALLGPYAAFLVMFSILAVQALFFADGGLLALGCNVFNMGFWSCFVAYPMIFRKIADGDPRNKNRVLAGAVLASMIGLQFGAFGVVLETLASGISELPFKTFVLLMQPIHLAIGLVEGIVIAAMISFVWRARPELLEFAKKTAKSGSKQVSYVISVFALLAIMTGGVLSWFASAHPDGLEWAMLNTSGKEELNAPADMWHQLLSSVQEKTAFLPDYALVEPEAAMNSVVEATPEAGAEEQWPAISAGTSLSGIVGGAIVLLLSGLMGISLNAASRRF